MKKIADVLLKLFAWGVLITLLIGGLSALGYIIAIILGGETATIMCAFLYKTFFPWVIKITSICTGIGLLGMYLGRGKKENL